MEGAQKTRWQQGRHPETLKKDSQENETRPLPLREAEEGESVRKRSCILVRQEDGELGAGAQPVLPLTQDERRWAVKVWDRRQGGPSWQQPYLRESPQGRRVEG